MGIKDYNNKEIITTNQHCNSFVTLNKEIKEVTKLFRGKEVVEISYQIKVVYR